MEKNSYKIIALLSSVFMAWGIITSANSVLVPYFKELFSLNYQQSMLVQVAFYIAPFVSCIPTSMIMSSKGYKKTLLYSLSITTFGLVLFYLMIEVHSYVGVLLSVFFIAVGVASMQVVACPYIIRLTPNISSLKIFSFTSSINSLGTVVAPIGIGATIAILGIANIYLILALFILILIMCIYRASITNFKNKETLSFITQMKAIRYHYEFIAGAIAIFVYVGIEVAIGTITISYLHHPDIGNVSMNYATTLIGLYWACAMVGRFLYSAIADKVNPSISLMLSGVTAICLLIFSMYVQNFYGGIALICIGLCNSFLHPIIFSSSIKKLGELTGLGSAILIMCNIGGGVVPLMQAAVIDMFNIATSYIVPLIGYIVIIGYAVIYATVFSKSERVIQ
ncbi:MFS transporter [Vibrio sp. MA40-2]|uniref:MFS transporter n=1 Tax=Vibrio sp. MA40-2 TaxID=3391828 RepID=UPI0039A40679